MTFNQWIRNQCGRPDRIADLADDIVADAAWPARIRDPKMLYSYLRFAGACDEALEIFEEAYAAYEEEETVPSGKRKSFLVRDYDDIQDYYRYLEKYQPQHFTEYHRQIREHYRVVVLDEVEHHYSKDKPEQVAEIEVLLREDNENLSDDEDSADGFTYLIQCGEYVKIGRSCDVQARLATLQTGCPHDLTLLGSFKVPHAVDVESALHQIYARFRKRGEWFLLRADMIPVLYDFVKSIASTNEMTHRDKDSP